MKKFVSKIILMILLIFMTLFNLKLFFLPLCLAPEEHGVSTRLETPSVNKEQKMPARLFVLVLEDVKGFFGVGTVGAVLPVLAIVAQSGY